MLRRSPGRQTRKRPSQKGFRSRNRNPNPFGQKPVVETTGELFSDGCGIELIQDSGTEQLDFVVFDGKTLTIAPRFEHAGRIHVPPVFDPVTLRALRFPSKVESYGSTAKLFAAMQEVLTEHDFPGEIALRANYFILSAWFPDCLPITPTLLITGPSSEANFLLQLLSCMVRHPLPLVDIDSAGLRALPRSLRPTLLIQQEHLSLSARKSLSASNKTGCHVSHNGELISVCFVKVLYRGLTFDDEFFMEGALRVNLTPLRGRVPILDSKAQEEIAGKLQPMLADYRLRNFARVRDSQFELPEFSSGIRVLSRILGACIIDNPGLQIGLRPLLRELEDQIRVGRWSDPRCVVIEALLYHCHTAASEDLIHVGEIAKTVTTIFRARGETTVLGPKSVGAVIRSFYFSLKRDNRGWALRLTDANRHRIHRLARDLDVAAVQEGMSQCAHCADIIAACDRQNPKPTDPQKTRVAQRKGRT